MSLNIEEAATLAGLDVKIDCIVNNFTKTSESWLSLAIAYPAVRSEGGDVVLVANAPEGLVTHYLLGPFGKTIGGNLRLPVKAPSHVNHLIIYTQYPDITGRGWVQPSDKILFMSN